MENYIGRTIEKIHIKDDIVYIKFNKYDFLKVIMVNTCCEELYFTSDDKLEDFNNSVLLDISFKESEEACEDEDLYGGIEHDIGFLEILTSNGTLHIKAHNEHNGYYGGFYVKLMKNEYNLNLLDNIQKEINNLILKCLLEFKSKENSGVADEKILKAIEFLEKINPFNIHEFYDSETGYLVFKTDYLDSRTIVFLNRSLRKIEKKLNVSNEIKSCDINIKK